MKKLNQFKCSTCHELWPQESDICNTCTKHPNIFTIENDMIPNFDNLPVTIRKHFEDLTMIEEQLISPISAIMSIFRMKGGQLFSNGYCANFIKDIEPLCKILPRMPSEVSLLVILKKDNNLNNKEFIVNRQRVEIVLRYLCNSNDLWKSHGIKISEENLLNLPVNGIPVEINELVDDDNYSTGNNGPVLPDNETNDDELHDIHTYVDVDRQELRESEKIKAKIQFPFINPEPINEYEYEGIKI